MAVPMVMTLGGQTTAWSLLWSPTIGVFSGQSLHLGVGLENLQITVEVLQDKGLTSVELYLRSGLEMAGCLVTILGKRLSIVSFEFPRSDIF